MWRYAQRTGEMVGANGEVFVGYAGRGVDKNRPESQGLANRGPLPSGRYTIGAPRETKLHGPYVLPLEPDASNDMRGRSAFLIHGDSAKRPGFASQGCIILPRAARKAIWQSGDRVLEVWSGDVQAPRAPGRA